jgi:hypothetical protein
MVAIDDGLIWWIDWLDACMSQTSPVDIVRQIPPNERVVRSLYTATITIKQAGQPEENS